MKPTQMLLCFNRVSERYQLHPTVLSHYNQYCNRHAFLIDKRMVPAL